MKKNNKILASVKYIHAKITSTITNELLQYIINKMYGKKWNTPNPNERTIYKIRIKSFTVVIPVILKLNVLNKFSYLKTQETQIK